MRTVIGWSLKLRVLVLTLAVGVVAVGLVQLAGTRPDGLPELAPVHIEVQTEALGLSANEVEELITAPLEADLLNGVAFVEDISSTSMPGLSSVVLVFEPGVDLYRARQLVQERLTQAAVALPAVATPPAMLEPTSSAARLMIIGMSSRDQSLIEQSVLARWTIRPRLMGVPGVANVAVFGERDRQLQVLVDPRRLAENQLTMADIIATSGNATWASPLTFLEASTPGTGGFIDTPNQRLGVRHVLPIDDAGQLAAVAVDGRPDLRLGDVATVVEDHPLLIGDAVDPTPGADAGLMIVVEKFPGRNTLEVTRGIEEALQGLRPGLPGIEFDTSLYRPAGYLESVGGNVTRYLGLGLALATLVIGLLFGGWRPALITAAVLSVALAGAGAVLLLVGAPLDLVIVLGLVTSLPVLIAGTVADTDAACGELRRRVAGESTSAARAILNGTVRTRAAVGCATLVAAAALAPVLVLGGSPGRLLTSFAGSYLLASAVAVLISLTLTPALCFLLLARPAGHGRDPRPLHRLGTRFARLAPRLQRRPAPALTVAAGLLVAAALAVPLLSTSVQLTPAEPDVLVDFAGPPGASRTEMNRVAGLLAAELRTIPGVTRAGAHLGRAILSDRVTDVNSGQLWVHIDEAADHEATLAAVTAAVDGYPGLDRAVSSYQGRQAADTLTPPATELRIRVYGEDAAGLAAQAARVSSAIAGIEGVRDPVVSDRPLTPAIQVRVDLAAAQRFGLKPGDVRRAAATLVSGLTVGTIFERQKVFDVVVWGAPAVRGNVAAVQDLAIDLPAGGQVRLADVAAVGVGPVPATVPRHAASRYVDVVAGVDGGVDGRGYGAVAADVRRALLGLPFDYGYRAELQSDYADWSGALTRTAWTAAAALLVIFLLMQAALRSWRLAAVALLTLPMALSGGAVAAGLTGGVLTIGSLAGLLAVLALAAGQVVALFRQCQQLEDAGHRYNRPELLARATTDRLGPVLIAAAACGVALLPMALAGPIAGLELLAPMAVVVLGGLVTSTVVTLFVAPALYLRYADHRRRDDDWDSPPPATPETATPACTGPDPAVVARPPGAGEPTPEEAARRSR
jgi:Cu/Ag efflux pump CusA